MKTHLPLFLILFLISCNQDPTVNLSGDLEIGIEQTGHLDKKVAKSYQIVLDSNSFITGYVNQKTVDVVVKLFNDKDEEVENFDSPARGHENFSFNIKESGNYRLDVEPFKEETGDYSILIKSVEPIATDPSKRVDQLLSFYSNDAPGAVIGVIDNGEMVFSKAYGKANLTHNLDFKLSTPTNIGSVSKQFTAFAILLLEQQGLLSIDDDVRKHIPEIPDLGEVNTIKNLLNHTNGYREIYNLMPIRGWNGEDVLLKEEVLNILKNQKELQASPGEEYNYNNSAFIMLAEIVERKTESTFPEWMKEHVFEPLGMNDTYVRPDPTQIIPGSSQGYSNGDNGFVESGDLYAAYGAGGIYTTPADLAKWLNNFHKPDLGGEEIIEKLVTAGRLNNGDTLDYGLGIGVGDYKGIKRYAHGGADIAHRAMLIYFPEINSGVITLSNNASFSGGISNDIVDLFFNDHFVLEEEAEEEVGEESEEEENVELDEETLQNYVGKYKAESIGMVIEYKLEEGALVAYPTGQSALPLEPNSNNSFTYTGIEATVVFNTDDEGKSTGAIHTQGGTDYDLTLLPPFDPSLSEMEMYTGTYLSEELETFYTIRVKDSAMIAEHRNLKDIKLSPTEEDTFSGDVYFIGEMAFKRNSSGEVEAFTVSNGRTKGIYFEKQ